MYIGYRVWTLSHFVSRRSVTVTIPSKNKQKHKRTSRLVKADTQALRTSTANNPVRTTPEVV